MQEQESLTGMLAMAHAMASHTGAARPPFSINQHGGRLVIQARLTGRLRRRGVVGVASAEESLSDGLWWSCSRRSSRRREVVHARCLSVTSICGHGW